MQTLADYQEVAYEWLHRHTRGILADDPGVGKTLPAIKAGMLVPGLHLIVAPAYLLANWEAYLEDQGVTNVQVVKGSRDGKIQQLIPGDYCSWVIVSYDTLARIEYERVAKQIPWSVVIADECHRLRGRNTKRTNMAYRLFKDIPFVWGLTGTPIVSNAGDVFPLLKICDPSQFSSYWRFVEENAKIEVTYWAKVVHGPKNQEQFNAMLRPYMLRRTVEEVLPELPDYVETAIRVNVSEATVTKIKQAKEQYLLDHPDGIQTRIGAGGLISVCRQLVNEDGVKVEAMLDLLEDIPKDEQVVVFTWHRLAAVQAQEALMKAGGPALLITGAEAVQARARTVEAFQRKSCRFLVATLASTGEGVNLQNARYVVFLEQDWLATTNEQAIARLHRRGQQATVLCYTILARRTVDESVHKAAARRAAISEVFDDLWREV